MAQIVLAFDLYGTLLSTESIALKLAEHFGDDTGKTIAASWRRYQLEYTWRLNSMGTSNSTAQGALPPIWLKNRPPIQADHDLGKYDTFFTVTKNALSHALAEHGVSLNTYETDKLMEAYDQLSTFTDVPAALDKIASNPTLMAVVFSNGTADMLSNSVLRSDDLAHHASSTFKDIISVDPVKKFKPAPEVYRFLADKVGKDKGDSQKMGEMWLISGNAFDVRGALNVGMKAAWVDRAGGGWVDALDPECGRRSWVRI